MNKTLLVNFCRWRSAKIHCTVAKTSTSCTVSRPRPTKIVFVRKTLRLFSTSPIFQKFYFNSCFTCLTTPLIRFDIFGFVFGYHRHFMPKSERPIGTQIASKCNFFKKIFNPNFYNLFFYAMVLVGAEAIMGNSGDIKPSCNSGTVPCKVRYIFEFFAFCGAFCSLFGLLMHIFYEQFLNYFALEFYKGCESRKKLFLRGIFPKVIMLKIKVFEKINYRFALLLFFSVFVYSW